MCFVIGRYLFCTNLFIYIQKPTQTCLNIDQIVKIGWKWKMSRAFLHFQNDSSRLWVLEDMS